MSFSDLYMEYLKKQRRKNNVVGKVFFFSTVSALAAASIALLTSPKSGSDNRKDIAKFGKKVTKQAQNLEHNAEEKFDALKDRAEKRFSELRGELSGRVESLRRKLGEQVEDVSDDAASELTKTARTIKRKTPVIKRVIKGVTK